MQARATRAAASFGGLRLLRLFGFARARENAGQRVVAFVTRVLVDVRVDRDERQLAGERGCERRGILDGEAIHDLVLRDARESLGDHGVLRGAAEALLRTKVA